MTVFPRPCMHIVQTWAVLWPRLWCHCQTSTCLDLSWCKLCTHKMTTPQLPAISMITLEHFSPMVSNFHIKAGFCHTTLHLHTALASAASRPPVQRCTSADPTENIQQISCGLCTLLWVRHCTGMLELKMGPGTGLGRNQSAGILEFNMHLTVQDCTEIEI